MNENVSSSLNEISSDISDLKNNSAQDEVDFLQDEFVSDDFKSSDSLSLKNKTRYTKGESNNNSSRSIDSKIITPVSSNSRTSPKKSSSSLKKNSKLTDLKTSELPFDNNERHKTPNTTESKHDNGIAANGVSVSINYNSPCDLEPNDDPKRNNTEEFISEGSCQTSACDSPRNGSARGDEAESFDAEAEKFTTPGKSATQETEQDGSTVRMEVRSLSENVSPDNTHLVTKCFESFEVEKSNIEDPTISELNKSNVASQITTPKASAGNSHIRIRKTSPKRNPQKTSMIPLREGHNIRINNTNNSISIPLELSKIELDVADDDSDIDIIPQRIKDIVIESNDSVLVSALKGIPISGYNLKTIDKVLSKLKKYLNECIKEGWIFESQFMESVVEQVKIDRKENIKCIDINKIFATNDQLNGIKQEIELYENYFQSMKSKIEDDRMLAIKELENKLEEDLDVIDYEWTSHLMVKKYNKPSVKIFELRNLAQRMLMARRFDEAAIISRQIDDQEKEEAILANKKMQTDYEHMIRKREDKHQIDVQNVNQYFDSKLNHLKKESDITMVPLKRRYDRIKAKREKLAEPMSLPLTRSTSPNGSPFIRTNIKDVVISRSKTLKIPPLTKVKRKALAKPPHQKILF